MSFANTHHSFSVEIASIYGVNEAILIHHFQHWIIINMRAKRNFKDGRTWSYQSLDEIALHFPYLSKSEIFELLERLCTGKGRRSKKTELDFEPVLMKGCYNKEKYDKTTWYAFVDEKKFTILAQAKMDDGSSQNGYQPEPTPIPDSLPDPKPKTVCPNQGSVSKIKKFSPDKKVFEIHQDEIYKRAVADRKDWATNEIAEAWDILVKYEGAIGDWYRFIEGTIQKIRDKLRFNKISKAKETETKPQHGAETWPKVETKDYHYADQDTIKQLFLKHGLPLPN